MAIRTIVLEGDEILRKKCRDVEKFDGKLAALLDDMWETLYKRKGVGLAGPQVGILRRVAVIDVGDQGDGPVELVNPVIVRRSGSETKSEGCLSSPGEWGLVERPTKVKVKAQDRNGKEFVIEGRGLLARALCHEIDHLSGILFKDRAIRMLDPDEA